MSSPNKGITVKIKQTVVDKRKTLLEKNNHRNPTTSIPQQFPGRKLIQICTSGTITYFGKHARQRYGLVEYKSIREPTIFYGCYREADFDRIRKHRGPKYLVWGGGDVIKHGAINKVQRTPGVVHIAQSNFIQKALDKAKIKNIYVPFSPTIKFDGQFKPVPKGRGIYIYTSAISPEYYGGHFYYRITKQFPRIPFYITSSQKSITSATKKGLPTRHIKCYGHNTIHEVYQKCFVGLRLVKHDGISATVQEMGLMGIKTIHNGCTPSSANYKTYDNVVRIIEQEYKTIGKVDKELSDKVKQHLDIDLVGIINDLGA